MPTARTLVTDALIEVGVLAESDADLPAADGALGLRILNRDIMDRWTAVRPFAFTRVITSGTFAASTATRTVGPTGSYVLTPRPIAIYSAYWEDSNDIRYPIRIRDEEWYANLIDPEFTAANITDIAYFPTAPNGTMYPWPIPTAVQTVRIETDSVLAQFATLDTSADFAPGYESAVIQTLKEMFCRAWHRPMPEGLAEDAIKTRALIQTLNPNMRPPRIATDDIGGRGGDWFDTKTREMY